MYSSYFLFSLFATLLLNFLPQFRFLSSFLFLFSFFLAAIYFLPSVSVHADIPHLPLFSSRRGGGQFVGMIV